MVQFELFQLQFLELNLQILSIVTQAPIFIPQRFELRHHAAQFYTTGSQLLLRLLLDRDNHLSSFGKLE